MANVAKLVINGKTVPIDAEPSRTLLSVLRDDLDLTGAKYGCGEGECGACTVLLDGVPARACVTSVAKAAGSSITTIEGIEQEGRLHPLQEAFLEAGAMQCGYCTSGMILSGVALLRSNANPLDEDIIHAMDGNICRCGTYQRILAAIRAGAKALSTK
jgi:nicotinate dehydrogenase subunit A